MMALVWLRLTRHTQCPLLVINGTYLIPKASWVSYLPQVKANNKEAVILDTFFKDNYKVTAKTLTEYCNKNKSTKKILILNSPNNPSGAVYSSEELEQLATVCRKYHIIVLSDEIYSQITYHVKTATSISNYYPENTIVYGGLSEVFSAGGYRLGYMVLPENFNEFGIIFQSLFSETFSSVSASVQYAALTAYNYKRPIKKHVEASVKILNFIGDYVFQNLTKAGVTCTQPQGGFYVLIGFDTFKEKLHKKQLKTSIELANYLLDEYKIALLPGIDFYFNPEEFIFRLAYVDFNGRKALKKVLKNDVSLDTKFMERYAPNVIHGIQKIIEFVKTLK